jgi:hypothetical protein
MLTPDSLESPIDPWLHISSDDSLLYEAGNGWQRGITVFPARARKKPPKAPENCMNICPAQGVTIESVMEKLVL